MRYAPIDPKLFTDPQSLSFSRIDVSTGAQRASLLLTALDAGGGAGTWTVSLAPQAGSTGVTPKSNDCISVVTPTRHPSF